MAKKPYCLRWLVVYEIFDWKIDKIFVQYPDYTAIKNLQSAQQSRKKVQKICDVAF